MTLEITNTLLAVIAALLFLVMLWVAAIHGTLSGLRRELRERRGTNDTTE